jgi:phytanoyl-CoA hydroxylase
MASTAVEPTIIQLDEDTVSSYRRNGFVHVPSVLTAEEVARYREAAERVHAERDGLAYAGAIFKQIIQLWTFDDVLGELTRHPALASLATQLSGIPMRIWHDQLLVKAPHNGARTEFHQDQPYWPHHSRHSLSAWIALTDVPVERGCMTFIPGQQERVDIRPVDLTSDTDMFAAAPDLTWRPRVTIPLRAGDVTFHNGYTPHTANANDTDEFRWAQVNIYIDRETTYSGTEHIVTDELGLSIGDPLPDAKFPPVG